jgi:hypothetical protein
MFRRAFSRSFLGLLITATLAVFGVSGIFAAAPAQAYGPENYQQTFAGTGSLPGGASIGFWGWCTYGGGTGSLPTSGTTGDCSYAYYIHASTGKITCHQSVDITAWTIQQSSVLNSPDFFVTGTASVNPPNDTACYSLFPGVFPPSFTDVDTLLPAVLGHQNLNGATIAGVTWTELQFQLTAIP